MDIPPEKMARYRESARRREAERRQMLAQRLERAHVLARQAADLLKQPEFGASRVVLIGSLLHPELFHAMSDIDLVVWDIQHYFRAVSRLIDLDYEFNFDLIPVEDAKEWVLELAESEGIDL